MTQPTEPQTTIVGTPVAQSSSTPQQPASQMPAQMATTTPVVAAPAAEKTMVPAGYVGVELVSLAIGIVDVILALAFIFQVSAAHDVGFAAFIFSVGGSLASPFQNIWPQYLAIADIVALVVYTAAAFAVMKLIRILAVQHRVNSQ